MGDCDLDGTVDEGGGLAGVVGVGKALFVTKTGPLLVFFSSTTMSFIPRRGGILSGLFLPIFLLQEVREMTVGWELMGSDRSLRGGVSGTNICTPVLIAKISAEMCKRTSQYMKGSQLRR